MPISTTTHARRYLEVADLDAQVLALLRGALRATARNRDSWPTLERLEQWTSSQLDVLDVDPDEALADDDVLDVLASAYLVASRVPPPFRRVRARSFHRHVDAVLDSLEPDFIPELLRETRRRKETDESFAEALARSRRAVVDLVRRASESRAEIVESLPPEIADDSDRPVTLREEVAGAVAIGVFVVILVIAVTVAWIAYNDPAKDPESEDDEDGEDTE